MHKAGSFRQTISSFPADHDVDCQRQDIVCYELDIHDRIIWVNQGWTTFALENDGHALVPDKVIGTSFWECMTDPETRHLYQLILAKVRYGHHISLYLHCDSPSQPRLAEIAITPQADGRVHFTSVICTDEQRRSVIRLEHMRDRTNMFLVLCSWCTRVKLPDDTWVELEKAIEQLQLFAAPTLPNLTHGICEKCSQRLLAELTESSS